MALGHIIKIGKKYLRSVQQYYDSKLDIMLPWILAINMNRGLTHFPTPTHY